MKLLAYVRVSTPKQSLDGQKEKIQKWADLNNHEVKFFEDIVSAIDDRPKFNAMMDNIKDYDGVVVTALDRFGRSVNQLSNYFDTLTKMNKQLIVLDQNIDTTKKEGRFLLNILFAVSELERDIIYERMEAGKERARKKGVKFGRKKKVLPMETIIGHYKNGASWSWICSTFGISSATLSDRLKDAGILKSKEVC